MVSGQKIRTLRLIMNKRQQDVAAKLRITQQAYSKIEKKAVVCEDTSRKIFAILGCDGLTIENLQNLHRFFPKD